MIELFRKEVLERQGVRLQGDIFLALPVSWQALSYLFLVAFIAGSAFLFSTAYTQFQRVQGIVTPDKGLAAVLPTRSGVLAELFVAEGSVVRRGMPIGRVRVAEVLRSGATTSDAMSAAMASEEQSLRGEAVARNRVGERDAARQAEQVSGLKSELRELRTQVNLQRQLLQRARDDLEAVRTVAKNGFISRRDLEGREESIMVRRQQLAQLEQVHAAKTAALAEARRTIEQLGALANADRAGAQVRLRALQRQRVLAAAEEGYLITAPLDGIATAVSARVGQVVTTTSTIFSIVPAGSTMRAELLVPANIIGFVRAGHEVLLAIDGFPVEQYGTIRDSVLSVPASTVTRADAAGNPILVYVVPCVVDRPGFVTDERRLNLVAGMTFTARIAMRRQSLARWLLSPLAGLAQR